MKPRRHTRRKTIEAVIEAAGWLSLYLLYKAKLNTTREPSRITSDNVTKRFWRTIVLPEEPLLPVPITPGLGVGCGFSF